MFQQNLKLKKTYKLVKVIRYYDRKSSVTWMHKFLKSSKRIKLQFDLNPSNSDMYSVLGWLLQFPIPLPFLGGVSSQFGFSRKLLNLKQRVSLATFGSDHLAEQGSVKPIGRKQMFFFMGDVVFSQRLRSEATAHRIGAKVNFSFFSTRITLAALVWREITDGIWGDANASLMHLQAGLGSSPIDLQRVQKPGLAKRPFRAHDHCFVCVFVGCMGILYWLLDWFNMLIYLWSPNVIY